MAAPPKAGPFSAIPCFNSSLDCSLSFGDFFSSNASFASPAIFEPSFTIAPYCAVLPPFPSEGDEGDTALLSSAALVTLDLTLSVGDSDAADKSFFSSDEPSAAGLTLSVGDEAAAETSFFSSDGPVTAGFILSVGDDDAAETSFFSSVVPDTAGFTLLVVDGVDASFCSCPFGFAAIEVSNPCPCCKLPTPSTAPPIC
uniref:Uncharacterized protein n=1 Tax=Candidatus Berkiella aquae TaxID=295108 RepID=A0A0Q9YEF9_9GAMM